jgi:hypothetical protein
MESPVRKIVGAVLLLLSLPMFAGEIFEISGLISPPSLRRTIVIGLGAQIMALLAGLIASPVKGKIGFVRAAALIIYFIQSLPLPMVLFALLYKRVYSVELYDSYQLTCLIVTSCSAMSFLLVLGRMWNLSLGLKKKTTIG